MLFLTCLLISVGLTTAQNQTVTGTVISEEDGEPVVGASVLVEGTTVGTITDIDGRFTLSNIPSSAKTLQVSYIGMVTQNVAIRPNIRVVLKSDTHLIDEVVVTAMGITREKKALVFLRIRPLHIRTWIIMPYLRIKQEGTWNHLSFV